MMLGDIFLIAFTVWPLFLLKRILLGDATGHLPTAGLGIPGLSVLDMIWFFFDSPGLIQHGYKKYPAQVFRVALPNQWLVIVGSLEHIEEMRKAPEDVLSKQEGANELLQTKYTFGDAFLTSVYHIPIIRNQLTKSTPALFEGVLDEIITAIGDVFTTKFEDVDGWNSLPAAHSIIQVMARTSNRVFVGLPMCRHPEFLDIGIRFTEDVVTAATFIEPFPTFIRPIIARLFGQISRERKRCTELLEGEIQGRLNTYRKTGKMDKVDVLSWLIEDAPGEEQRSIFDLSMRILSLNFVSIHTTSLTFLQALFHLAENPVYQQILREEIDTIVDSDGWTYAGIKKMVKVDSFLKEAQRLNPLACVMMQRRVMKPFTFASGGLDVTIPEGTIMAVPISSIHVDPSIYPEPLTFNPWRFLSKEPLIKTSRTFMAFGHGRTSCVGRFFASVEMKLMLARLVWEFDLGLPRGRPKNWWIASLSIPKPGAKIMLKRRNTSGPVMVFGRGTVI